ncbi:Protein APEM9 [Camellia lanceoleosa]|uniref:Protein APEM9 n=1 Tax=Camellia lanceoleosa TaxID=1840588 RepID=A0ACC0F2X8_9ERIC|nr:Protein APEM9 [Camellia lanceoleosa]
MLVVTTARAENKVCFDSFASLNATACYIDCKALYKNHLIQVSPPNPSAHVTKCVCEYNCFTVSASGVDKYLEVVEVYVVTLPGMVVRDIDHAICWVEKATLPEEKRQDLLRRLHSLYSPKAPVSSQGSVVALPGDKSKTHSSLKQQDTSEGSPEALKASYPFKRENDMKQAILKISQRVPCFWWFRTIMFKFGNGQLVISNAKIVLGCLMILMYYVLQRKQAILKRWYLTHISPL